jgi:hypothetical protein
VVRLEGTLHRQAEVFALKIRRLMKKYYIEKIHAAAKIHFSSALVQSFFLILPGYKNC